jgi:phosphatidylglycerophosphatase A
MNLVQPRWPKVFSTRVVLACARLGPIGRNLPAPGTWGSLVGIVYFLLFFSHLEIWETIIVSTFASYIAVGFCGEAEVRLGVSDPGEVILDECVAMPLVFLGYHTLKGTTPEWIILVAGFALFRLYDILKPLGISKLQNLNAGWGVVCDDLAAAFAACATLHLIRYLIPA